ncbi:pyridoxamine kinase [Neisseria sp. Ec49-e6-T10]|uniref:pyridoxamine kinase n=1 Tax=Neisseria sp. Ec49-e6-T10 TaxID=3140744 RepID=UPI003EBD232A
MTQKRVAAIHDISCFGRCSLTVALPILSAAGIETSVIPTAVLSTHTGGIEGYTFRDLTDDILPIVAHWKSLNLQFNGVYTGYLGSTEQISIVSQVFDSLKNDEQTLVFIDPVMADHGQLYNNFSEDYPKQMAKLCEKADMVIPNMTEAAFLLGEPYQEGPYTQDYIEQLLKKLSALGPKTIFLTGVSFHEQELGAAAYEVKTGKISYAFAPKIEGHFHGTGDVFASALLAAIMKNKSLEDALNIAVQFTVQSIQRTKIAQTDIRFGVNFEEGLSLLGQSLA